MMVGLLLMMFCRLLVQRLLMFVLLTFQMLLLLFQLVLPLFQLLLPPMILSGRFCQPGRPGRLAHSGRSPGLPGVTPEIGLSGLVMSGLKTVSGLVPGRPPISGRPIGIFGPFPGVNPAKPPFGFEPPIEGRLSLSGRFLPRSPARSESPGRVRPDGLIVGASPAGRRPPACWALACPANPPKSGRLRACKLPWREGTLKGGRVAIAADCFRACARFCALFADIPPPRIPRSGREPALGRIAAFCIPVIPPRLADIFGCICRAIAAELTFGCRPPIARAPAFIPPEAEGRIAPTEPPCALPWPPLLGLPPAPACAVGEYVNDITHDKPVKKTAHRR